MEYLIVLRIIHIICAVIWTGGMIYLTLFVIPAAKKLGPEGAKFIQRLFNTNKLPMVMSVSAMLTIITGMLLMKKLMGGFQLALFNFTHGALLGLGSLMALAAFIVGLSVNLPATKRITAISKTLAMAGQQPASAQVEELQKLRNRSFTASNSITVLLLVSLILMSMLKYL